MGFSVTSHSLLLLLLPHPPPDTTHAMADARYARAGACANKARRCTAYTVKGTRCKAKTSGGTCALHRRVRACPPHFATAFSAFRHVTGADAATRATWFAAERNESNRLSRVVAPPPGCCPEQHFVVTTGTKPIAACDAHLVDCAFWEPCEDNARHAYLCHLERNEGVCPLPTTKCSPWYVASGVSCVVECVPRV